MNTNHRRSKHRLTRRERFALATAALRGVLAGATHAILSFILDENFTS